MTKSHLQLLKFLNVGWDCRAVGSVRGTNQEEPEAHVSPQSRTEEPHQNPHGAQDVPFPQLSQLNNLKHATTQDVSWQRHSTNSKQMKTKRSQEAVIRL